MVHVVVGAPIADDIAARLADLRDQVAFLVVDREGQGADLAQADAGVRWNLSEQGLRTLLEHAPGLRWLHSASAGVESWPLDELRRREIILTNAAGIFAIPIAEWVLAAMLMLVKRSHAMQDAQREQRWARTLDLDELYDKTLLILGTGGIGQEVARRAAGFGMRIWGASRSGAAVEGVAQVVAGEAWRELLPEADIIVNTLPLTEATRGLIGAAELARLKPGAGLINVGRGATVDEAALLRALREGRLGGAAIDAWIEEPLPPDHAAWSTPNLIIWPHHSASSPHTQRRGLDLLEDNLRRFVRGQALRNVVNLDAGY